MTIDEAIIHAEEVAEEQEKYCPVPEGVVDKHKKCAKEHRQLAEWLRNYKRLLEQEPCDVSDTDVGKIDAVSRQAVLDLVSADWKYEGLESDIANLPSVNLQPKMGHWKQISPARIYECDICGQNVMTDDISAYRYCHGCGAKMVEPQESEE